jgi:hypothetical protein
MPTPREVLEHLFSCCDAIYLVLGEGAPLLSNDTYVVRVHEMSRSFGAVALAMRAQLGETEVAPLPVIEGVLSHALASDETGTMVLYAVAMVVGPRLLVSLRDAREILVDEPQITGLLERAAQVVVAEVRACADVLQSQTANDDPLWQSAARELTTTLESSGNVESFGLSR